MRRRVRCHVRCRVPATFAGLSRPTARGGRPGPFEWALLPVPSRSGFWTAFGSQMGPVGNIGCGSSCRPRVLLEVGGRVAGTPSRRPPRHRTTHRTDRRTSMQPRQGTPAYLCWTQVRRASDFSHIRGSCFLSVAGHWPGRADFWGAVAPCDAMAAFPEPHRRWSGWARGPGTDREPGNKSEGGGLQVKSPLFNCFEPPG
jgi:hypothetical protein